MRKTSFIDLDYLKSKLVWLLGIHSPSGYTDPVVRATCGELKQLGIDFELTRRGAIRATLPGETSSPDRAVVAHLDTLGGLVRELKDNGRLAVAPVGTWSSRFAEGARVSVFTDDDVFRGQVLPLKASGHTYNELVDTQPVGWDHVEVRIDERSNSLRDLIELGVRVGDYIGFDATVETFPNGYITARHLDDKAGVAAILAAAKHLTESGKKLPVDLHLLFTISEEVGSGASAVLHGDVAELISVDNGTAAPGQASSEFGATIAMADSTGPFDYHLTHHLIHLCQNHGIPHTRDVFKYYRCDSASAVEAGNDIRTALIAFGVDGSHGYERTNLDSLRCVSELLVAYATEPPLFMTQKRLLGTLDSFPKTRKTDVEGIRFQEADPIVQLPTSSADSSDNEAPEPSKPATRRKK